MMNGIKNRMRVARSFTLIELLVVVAIIAVLISILLPSLTMARMQATVVQCNARVRQMMMGAIAYGNDYQGKIPYFAFVGSYASNHYGYYNYATNRAVVDYNALPLNIGLRKYVIGDGATSALKTYNDAFQYNVWLAYDKAEEIFICPAEPVEMKVGPATAPGAKARVIRENGGSYLWNFYQNKKTFEQINSPSTVLAIWERTVLHPFLNYPAKINFGCFDGHAATVEWLYFGYDWTGSHNLYWVEK